MRVNLLIFSFITTVMMNNAKGNDDSKELLKNYGNIPLYFAKNEGQTDDRAMFIGRGNNCALFLTHQGVTFCLSGKGELQSQVSEGFSLHQSFVNSNSSSVMIGEEKLAGSTNYFIGNDPAQWKRNVSNYNKVRVKELYQGIDLVYYGNQNNLEYDFIIKPGIDPSQIKFSYDLGNKAGNTLLINTKGELVIPASFGDLIEHKPYCYQIIGGKKTVVEGNYKIVDKKNNISSFMLGSYDKESTLIIDPVIEYSTYFGGTGGDWCYGVVRDKSGNIYLSGNTTSTDFPTVTGVYPNSNRGNIDIFITKLDPSCTKIIYSTYIGGSGNDYGGKLAIDSYGNVYITANTNSYDFPVTQNAMFRNMLGPYNVSQPDIAIVKLAASGSSLIYSTYFGGRSIDSGGQIFADSIGNAYIALSTESQDLPVTAGVFGNQYHNKKDVYIMKLDPVGNRIFSSFLGGAEDDIVSCITTDKFGNTIVGGTTKSSDFPRTSKALDTTLHGDNDIFITKIKNDGTRILFSTLIGGKGNDNLCSLNIDNDDNIFIAGYTESNDFPTTKNAIGVSLNGVMDAFVSKISASGDKLLYSTLIGGSNYDRANSLDFDAAGNVYIAGTTNSTDFPVTENALDQTYNGGYYEYGVLNASGGDAFICQLDINKSKLKYSTFFGGVGNENLPQLMVNNSNELFIFGQTDSPDLPCTSNAINKSKKGGTDIFMTKMNINSQPSKNTSPVLSNPIADLTVPYNKVFKILIPGNVFTDKDNFEVLPLKFSLSNGDSLPAWMKYDAKTSTFIGLPLQEGQWKIKVSTVDNHKASASGEFQLKVTDPRKDKKTIDLEYGLVAYYPFNGNTNDVSHNHYNGIVKRAKLCEDKDGKPNSAYHFNGSDTYIQIDSIKDLNTIDVITTCAWIFPMSYERYCAWLSKPVSEDRSQIRSGFGREPDKNVGLTLFNDGSWSGYHTTNCQVPLNQWSYVVITANTITGDVRAYLNGKEVGSWQNMRRFPYSKFPLYIGFQVEDQAYFDGKIDEVRIYNRILSTDEISALYNLK